MIKHVLIRLSIFISLFVLIVLFCLFIIEDRLVAFVMAMLYSLILTFLISLYLLIESFWLHKNGAKSKRNFNLILSVGSLFLLAMLYIGG